MFFFAFVAVLLFLLGALDDLFIDCACFWTKLRWSKREKIDWKRWRSLPESPMAIVIPAWNEHAVLDKMVKTNLMRLEYKNYRFFVGVYPNDLETLTVANGLAEQYPELVTVVVTDRPGPTSKAHCLNCILRALSAEESFQPRFVAIHDAEDVIHPLSLKAVSAQEADVDFIQVPIFSLPVSAREWVACTYMDEFAEIHLRELPARAALGMPIPSAGVGTFFRWQLLRQIGARFHYFFDENNLTEDYEISYRLNALGAKQLFLLVRDPQDEIVATQEFFPESLGRSIKQKARWTLGIALQTWAKWGWFGTTREMGRDLLRSYALWRDRKSLWSNPLSLAALVSAFLFPLLLDQSKVDGFSHLLWVLIVINIFLVIFRLILRAFYTGSLYGLGQGAASIPRYFVSIFINGLASLRAIFQFFRAKFYSHPQKNIKWDKTEHKFPEISIKSTTEDTMI